MISVYILGMISFFVLNKFLCNVFFVFQRLLDVYSMLILSVCWLLQLIINFMATYLRAHKKEPLMNVSIFGAIYTFGITFFIVNNYSNEYFFLGFLSKSILTLPYVIYIFYLQRKEDLKI